MTLRPLHALLLLAAFTAACASAPARQADGTPVPPKPGSAGTGDQGAPIQVGSDIIVELPQADVWAVLTDTDNWGAWNKKVTGVAHAAGLNVGADLSYQWEEKAIRATITEVKEPELLVWTGARTGKDVRLRWMVKATDPAHTLISLRALLSPKAGATPIANASGETQQWMTSLQDELGKRVAAAQALKPAVPAKKAKRHKAPAQAATPAPAAATATAQ